jgi:hypothetical protein
MATCKFCFKNKKLVDAHIIPRAFFEAIKSGKGNKRDKKLKEVTNNEDRYPISHTTKGLYDSNMICLDCEQIFSPFDNYACKLLLKEQDRFIPKYINGELMAWQVELYDYEKIMLFFISFLWRAGNSELKQFERIQLGAFSDTAKKALSTQKLNDIDKFSILLTRFEEGYGRNIIMDPYLDRAAFRGINVYHFYLGAGYIVYIKVDKRLFPQDFEGLKISQNSFYILSRGKFENSHDLSIVQKVYTDAEVLVKSWKIKRKT